MKNKTNALLLIIGLLGFSLVGSVLLSGERQDKRGAAYFSTTKLSSQPESVSKNVGDEFTVQLYVNPKSGSKIDFVESRICLGEGVAMYSDDSKSNFTLADGFTEVVKAQWLADSRCIDFAVRSDEKKEDLPSGEAVKVATLKLKGIKGGSGEVTLEKGQTIVAGYNPNLSSRDMAIEVSETSGTRYTISGSSDEGGDEDEDEDDDGNDVGGTGPSMNFKVTSRKMDKDAKCGKKEKFTITLMGNGTSKVYKNVEAEWDGSSYKGNKKFGDFPYSKNLSVFIKGSKTLQMKYGKDGQTAVYNKAGGEIDLTVNKTYNFASLPLLPGDVTGEGGKQDGTINGLDFSFIKTKAAKREKTTDGGYLQADLDGNCLVNGLDVTAMMLSLEDKMDQLY